MDPPRHGMGPSGLTWALSGLHIPLKPGMDILRSDMDSSSLPWALLGLVWALASSDMGPSEA